MLDEQLWNIKNTRKAKLLLNKNKAFVKNIEAERLAVAPEPAEQVDDGLARIAGDCPEAVRLQPGAFTKAFKFRTKK